MIDIHHPIFSYCICNSLTDLICKYVQVEARKKPFLQYFAVCLQRQAIFFLHITWYIAHPGVGAAALIRSSMERLLRHSMFGHDCHDIDYIIYAML